MLSKPYEPTEVDRRTWLQVPSGTHRSTNSDTHQVVVILKETTKMYSPFSSDLINNMDHMRISGTEPSSVILSQTDKLCPKILRQAKAKTQNIIITCTCILKYNNLEILFV